MALYFITGNKHKFAEAQAIIPDLKQMDIDLPEIQELDPRAIIKAKLLEAQKHRRGTFFIEDTSLYFEGLNGLPGPLIKWFLSSLGNTGLAKLAINSKNTRAVAKTIIGFSSGKNDLHFFEGAIKGNITKPRGKTAFGWDPIFIPDGYNQSFAELGQEIKNKISMRRRALIKLKKFLTKYAV
jgi:non-canonical purine NTP pyrophosphatase (RdgB/HAM1 family)